MSSQLGSVPSAPSGGASSAGAPRARTPSNARGCLTVLTGIAVLGVIAFVVTWLAMLLTRGLGV
ncbi:MAG: hypothetical protein KJZ54_01775 [Phycisphaerales bacterium]|nr:hypothetical protein [Phycisphaerales bacterium]